MDQKINELEKRVTKLSGPESPEENRAIVFESDLTYRALQCLTDAERQILRLVLLDATNAGVDSDNEDWLTERSQDEQAVVRKILARFKELSQEGKST
jgi:hypothetical protein